MGSCQKRSNIAVFKLVLMNYAKENRNCTLSHCCAAVIFLASVWHVKLYSDKYSHICAPPLPGTNFCINCVTKESIQNDFIMGRIKFCNLSNICIVPHFRSWDKYFNTALHFSILMSFSIPCVHFQLDCFITIISCCVEYLYKEFISSREGGPLYQPVLWKEQQR
jgi:hypothetical protein